MQREPRLFRSGAEADYLSRWKRIIYIDQQLRAEVHPSRKRLAHECGVSEKTIQRDIEAMRVELDAPIDYDARRNGYRYTDAGFAIPAAVLGERDLFALMVAESALAQYAGTPLHDHLRAAFERILEVLPGEVRAAHELTARAVHFGGEPREALDPEVWSTLVGAIHHRSVVELTWQDGRPEPVVEELHPYLLVTRDGAWVLVAHDPRDGAERFLRLPAVHRARRLEAGFELRDDFDAEQARRRAFGD